MKIYLIRHGQTEWNKLKVMQGQTDIPLNETGVEQACMVGDKLKDIKLDYTFCSPLTRTRQTLDNLGIDTGKVIFDDRLKERSYGEYEKQPKDSFDYNGFWRYHDNIDCGTAERCQEFFARVIDLIEQLKQNYQDSSILVIAHAGVTRVFKWYFDGLQDDEIAAYLPANCEVIEYTC